VNKAVPSTASSAVGSELSPLLLHCIPYLKEPGSSMLGITATGRVCHFCVDFETGHLLCNTNKTVCVMFRPRGKYFCLHVCFI